MNTLARLHAEYICNTLPQSKWATLLTVSVYSLPQSILYALESFKANPLTPHLPCTFPQLILDALESFKANPLTPSERVRVQEDIQPPMLHGNHESISDKCFVGLLFTKTVIESEGWEYKNEGKSEHRPKRGYISRTPGKILKLKVNSTSPTGNPDQPVRQYVDYIDCLSESFLTKL
jgi:hypothetical protein